MEFFVELQAKSEFFLTFFRYIFKEINALCCAYFVGDVSCENSICEE